ncbi:hypothetical protein ZWY2020_007737 [Hordeum vulgare]|nr:hypothetical protein ZWY2020_007737 [Hordeum vulgare]
MTGASFLCSQLVTPTALTQHHRAGATQTVGTQRAPTTCRKRPVLARLLHYRERRGTEDVKNRGKLAPTTVAPSADASGQSATTTPTPDGSPARHWVVVGERRRG